MRAGRLRHKLIIQQATETQGTTGELAVSWGIFATVWGAVEPLRGREFFAAQELQAEVTTRIRMRYLAGVTPKMRVLYGETIFLINAVIDPEMRHRELQLMCVEVVET